jgi:hypothetical protein
VDRDCAYGRKTVTTGATMGVGSAAIDRALANDLYEDSIPTSITCVVAENPASADTTITSVSLYCHHATAGNSVKVGTFSAVGNTLTCHDSVSVGALVVGLNTFNGLSLAISTGEYIGACGFSQNVGLDRAASGGAGIWDKLGEYIDPTDSAAFTWTADWTLSLYGTGVGGEQAAIIVGLAASVDRDVAYGRTSTLGAGLAATVSRAVAIARSSTLTTGLAATVTRALAILRSSTLGMGFSVSIDFHPRDVIAYVKGTVKNLHKVVGKVKRLYTTKGDEY